MKCPICGVKIRLNNFDFGRVCSYCSIARFRINQAKDQLIHEKKIKKMLESETREVVNRINVQCSSKSIRSRALENFIKHQERKQKL